MRCRPRAISLAAAVALAAATLGGIDSARASGHVQAVTIESHDGVPLAGRVVFPAPPGEGQRFPVALWSSPYAGSLDAHVDENQQLQGRAPVVPVQTLLDAGYAVVGFNSRGTGDSGGCFDMFGAAEQSDQRALLDWIAHQPWSDGNIAVLGHSSDAISALWAAVSEHPALKTVVVSGIVTDIYTAVFSPQGAVIDDQMWSAFAPFFTVLTTAPPRPFLDPTPTPGELVQNFVLSGYLGNFPARVCRELAEDVTVTAADTFARESFAVWRQRSAAWYEERRLLPHLGRVKAAVLLAHGFQDYLAFEEDRVWKALDSAPKWQWEGQWKHTSRPTYRYRQDVLVPWLHYWLKGTGAPPSNLNRVSYQISPVPWNEPEPPAHGPTEGWPTSTAWPPADATEVALRLTPAGLRAKPSPESRTFHARPDEAERQASIEARDPDMRPVGYAPPCPGTADGETRLVYESLPVAEETVIAGNPSARLALRSSLPAGTFSVQLFDLAPDFGCPAGVATGYEFLTEGGADLRFLADRYTPQEFPAGEHEVRVQLQSLAEQLDPGHRLAVVLSLGPQKARLAQGHFPHLTIGGSSRILLPVTRGGLRPG